MPRFGPGTADRDGNDREQPMSDDGKGRPGERLAKALGVASVVLGAPLVAAPGRVARFVGLDDTTTTRAVARGVGLRELAAAAAILPRSRPLPGVWGRVAGDGMDLALLATALRAAAADRRRLAVATGAVAGIAALDAVGALRLSRRRHPTKVAEDGSLRVSAGVTVNRSAEDAYALWRDFTRLPGFMTHLESVTDEGKHWVAKRPGGGTVEWDAEITEDVPAERLAWRSLPGADVDNAGAVRFTAAPGGRGTEVRVTLRYDMPAGPLGRAVARYFGDDPSQALDDDLRRFKQILETGEVVRSPASPEGHRSTRLAKQRPGQPEGSQA
jgi:uncharacterized membrane protein